jgi:penicillin-binding protein 1A
VICGVRGTQYQVKYDPATNTVYLGVVEGTVYTTTNGHTTDYGAGSSAVFHNGTPLAGGNNGLPGGNGNNGNGNNGGNGDQGNGQGGNGEDYALGSLQDLNNQFQGNIISNGDGTFTDPSVEGSVRVNITAQIPVQEWVP